MNITTVLLECITYQYILPTYFNHHKV